MELNSPAAAEEAVRVLSGISLPGKLKLKVFYLSDFSEENHNIESEMEKVINENGYLNNFKDL